MNTRYACRTTMATSALAAALALFTVVNTPAANAMMMPRDPASGTSAQSTWPQIDEIVGARKEAAAEYYVDRAAELHLT